MKNGSEPPRVRIIGTILFARPPRRAGSKCLHCLAGPTPTTTMSNRNRKVVVAEAEPTFSQSCMAKWAKGLQRGAKWDKVSLSSFWSGRPSCGRPLEHLFLLSSAGLLPRCCFSSPRGFPCVNRDVRWPVVQLVREKLGSVAKDLA